MADKIKTFEIYLEDIDDSGIVRIGMPQPAKILSVEIIGEGRIAIYAICDQENARKIPGIEFEASRLFRFVENDKPCLHWQTDTFLGTLVFGPHNFPEEHPENYILHVFRVMND